MGFWDDLGRWGLSELRATVLSLMFVKRISYSTTDATRESMDAALDYGR